MSAFSVNIRGVVVTCNSIGELDVLLDRYGEGGGISVKGATPGPRVRQDMTRGATLQITLDDGKTWIDLVDYVKAVHNFTPAASHRGHISAACEIREALGAEKPHEAEWTWEHALHEVQGVAVNRNMWRDRAAEVTAQRERCDRMLADLQAKFKELQAMADDGKLFFT